MLQCPRAYQYGTNWKLRLFRKAKYTYANTLFFLITIPLIFVKGAFFFNKEDRRF